MTKTAEIVTFRLIKGADITAFIKAAAQMAPQLAQTGAVLCRELSVDDDGLWTDHILWTSRDAAQAAAARIMQDPAAAPFLSMIDGSSATMRHAAVHYQQE